MDEATSSLDSDSEYCVQQTISNYNRQEKTVIIELKCIVEIETNEELTKINGGAYSFFLPSNFLDGSMIFLPYQTNFEVRTQNFG